MFPPTLLSLKTVCTFGQLPVIKKNLKYGEYTKNYQTLNFVSLWEILVNSNCRLLSNSMERSLTRICSCSEGSQASGGQLVGVWFSPSTLGVLHSNLGHLA